MSASRHTCNFCEKQYNQRSSLSRHVKNEHGGYKENAGTIICSENNCKERLVRVVVNQAPAMILNILYRFISVDDLINHLKSSHNKVINVTTKTYPDLHSFMDWKEEFELKTSSSYVLHSSPKQRVNCTCYYYYCNRTGTYSSRGEGKRGLKIEGTSKIGMHCTAYIRAKKYVSGEVIVEVCNHHIHEAELAHLHLPDSIRAMIAAKLSDGVTISTILDSVRDNVECIDRTALLCRQDVYNVKHQYNIEGTKLHENDHTSVSLWVDSLRSKEATDDDSDNPIFIFKQQGHEQTSDIDDVGKNDFLIGIQTCFQGEMLKKFGPAAICMDSTHGTNVYDFYLITILVLDDLGEGVPVGWIISNREDAAIIRQVLSIIKEKCGDINTSIFMSDDADNFYNAWRSVFTVVNTKKLICAWHVDKSWRKGLQRHISSRVRQAEVYHHLRVLLSEGKMEVSFRLRLQQFISWLSNEEDLRIFLEYFQKEYVSRLEQWAPCYRIATVANTNMAVEAFHRSLKICYMEKKQNRRIDRLLHILLKIARDKVFERVIKTQKGKMTYRLSEINKRHRAAENIASSERQLSSLGDTSWKVLSTTKQSQLPYTVTKVMTQSCSCSLRCSSCGVCVHTYMCTCMDFILHSTVCKHIHLVEMDKVSKDQEKSSTTANNETVDNFISNEYDHSAVGNETEREANEEPDVSSLQYLSKCLVNSKSTDHASSVEKAVSLCKKIEVALLECTSLDAIKQGTKHLTAALTVIKSIEINRTTDEPPCFPTRKRPAPNANAEKQIRFKSTKKKRISSVTSLSKPDEQQKEKCIEQMDEIDIVVCGLCLREEDRNSQSLVKWTKCELCGAWYHESCARVNTDENDTFICKICSVE